MSSIDRNSFANGTKGVTARACGPPGPSGRLPVSITRYITGYMTQDIVKDLGHLTLGTRLKRLGERLHAQTQVMLEEAGIGLPASHFPILAGLDRLGQLSVGEIAEAVGMSQPGVTRMLEKLQTDGLQRRC